MRRPIQMPASLISVTILWAAVCGCGVATTSSPPAAEAVSEPAADAVDDAQITLTVTDEHGFEETIEALRGKVVLVDFWATWCLPCLAGFPHTVDLYDEFHQRGLEVVSVSFDEEADHDAALAFLKSNHATFTNLRSKYGFDSETAFQTEGGLPVLRVYDAAGKLVTSFTSGNPDAPPFTPDDVRQAVVQAIEARQSSPGDPHGETGNETDDDG